MQATDKINSASVFVPHLTSIVEMLDLHQQHSQSRIDVFWLKLCIKEKKTKMLNIISSLLFMNIISYQLTKIRWIWAFNYMNITITIFVQSEPDYWFRRLNTQEEKTQHG